MKDRYTLLWLSDMDVPTLKHILQEQYGLSAEMVDNKRKVDLIDMVCNQQDPVDRPVAPSSPSNSGDSRSASGKSAGLTQVSIGTEIEFSKSRVPIGAFCDVKGIYQGSQIHEPNAVYTGNIKARSGRVIALRFHIKGNNIPFIWKNIVHVYFLRP